MRGPRLLLQCGLCAVGVGATAAAVWLAMPMSTRTTPAEFSRAFITCAAVAITLVVGFVAPGATAGAFTLERERQTLEALLVCPLPRRSLVL
ncbi:MAG TPA: hypothetical protein PLQ54_05930, partial [Armatimonadota bacterium]|nr:hypothetical protein [Armatimonadota bacterium]